MTMRKLAALAALMFLLGTSAWSQSTNSAPELAPLSTLRYSREDTVRAVRHLFGQREQDATGYAAGGGALLGKGATATAQHASNAPQMGGANGASDWVGGSMMMAYGLFRLKRFGPKECEQVIVAYQQGEPLPGFVRRRLKTKHFSYHPSYLNKKK